MRNLYNELKVILDTLEELDELKLQKRIAKTQNKKQEIANKMKEFQQTIPQVYRNDTIPSIQKPTTAGGKWSIDSFLRSFLPKKTQTKPQQKQTMPQQKQTMPQQEQTFGLQKLFQQKQQQAPAQQTQSQQARLRKQVEQFVSTTVNDANAQDMKKTYKKLIRVVHPDVYKGGKQASEQLSARLNNKKQQIEKILRKTQVRQQEAKQVQQLQGQKQAPKLIQF
jgi:hypothetical protein